MKRRIFITLLLVVGFLTLTNGPWQGSAQVAKNIAATELNDTKFSEVRERLKTSTGLPFLSGEKLTYEMKLSRFPLSGVIGQLIFSINEEPMSVEEKIVNTTTTDAPTNTTTTKPPEKANSRWKISIDVKSKGILTSLFRIKVNDEFVSYVDKEDFGVTQTVKKIEEGKKRKHGVADFDRSRRSVKWVNSDLVTPTRPQEVKEKETLNWVTDIISGWYVLRAQDLSMGKKYVFPLSDDGETYEIEVEVLGREQIETELGKFSTIKLDMKLFANKFIKRKGKLLLWVTDDQRHLPVRAQIKSSFGTVVGTLIEAKPGLLPEKTPVKEQVKEAKAGL